jgi:DNA-binding MarR family transcriptional regulator
MQQPIGYWLNRTDQAITKRMNDILQTDGITRVGWQVLNVLQPDAGVPEVQVYDILQANATQAMLIDTIEDLVAKGWVMRTEHEPGAPPTVQLTDAGRAEHKRLHERITQFRQQSLQGISTDEYQTMIRVLERIVQNLE